MTRKPKGKGRGGENAVGYRMIVADRSCKFSRLILQRDRKRCKRRIK